MELLAALPPTKLPKFFLVRVIYMITPNRCHDRGSTSWLKRFLNDGALRPKIVGISFMLITFVQYSDHGNVCRIALSFLCPNQLVVVSCNGDPQVKSLRNTMAHLCRTVRLRGVAQTQVVKNGVPLVS